MRFFIRVAIVFVIVLAALSTLRGLFAQNSPSRSPSSGDSPGGPSKTGKLVKDPVCGTYVSDKLAISANRGSEVFHFCSDECRQKFIATGT
jgi:YHS domain-containing protein